jgi:hypothetical protein
MSAVAAHFASLAAMAAAMTAAYAVPRVCVYGIWIGEYPYGTPTGYRHHMQALIKARKKARVAGLVLGIGVVPTKVDVVPAKVVAGPVNDITVYPNGNGFVAHMHKEA